MAEGGRTIPANMPSVIPPLETRALDMTQAVQRLSYDLMLYFAPMLAKTTWRNCHRYDKAMNNGAQNGFDGGTPHADYINNRDLTATLPRYDKMQRGFAGTFIRGVDIGTAIRVDPGIHAIDATRPLPGVQEIVERNWYVIAINNTATPSHWAQGGGYPIVFPFIIDRAITFDKRFVKARSADYLPDPTKVYP